MSRAEREGERRGRVPVRGLLCRGGGRECWPGRREGFSSVPSPPPPCSAASALSRLPRNAVRGGLPSPSAS